MDLIASRSPDVLRLIETALSCGVYGTGDSGNAEGQPPPIEAITMDVLEKLKPLNWL